MKVTLNSRKPSRKFPLTIEIHSSGATIGELKKLVAAKTKLHIHRQRITTADKKVLEDDAESLASVGVKEGDALDIKDLGPQIPWRTVFLIEYFGPLFIHPFFYYAQELVYRQKFEHSKMQSIALVLVLAHYAKRELETIFVHHFSSATMPFFNVFKNSGHYWGLSGLLLAVPLYGPWNSAQKLAGTLRANDNYINITVGIWLYAELSNLITHLNLSSLRPAGTRVRKIPKGYGFNLVSCANYWFEVVAWVAFTALTLDYAALLFTVVATAQMAVWALKKHKRYRKEFGNEYPKGRKVMIPFVF
ncbi:enoyl reductase [Pseudohyphozyma bogoriensis]|nr:enoyl reductase [Pseudohyphozyma bogoriensis]